MSLPLFLVKRVKYLQSTYLTHVPVEVQAAVSEVAGSRCSVRTQLLSISTGASSYRIFQSAANSFQIRMGLHFQIIVLVTATDHVACGTGFPLFFIQATQILGNRNIIWTIQDTAQNPHKKVHILCFQWLPGVLLKKSFLLNEISSLSPFCSQTTRIFTNYLLKSSISRFLQLFYKQAKKSSYFTLGQLAHLVQQREQVRTACRQRGGLSSSAPSCQAWMDGSVLVLLRAGMILHRAHGTKQPGFSPLQMPSHWEQNAQKDVRGRDILTKKNPKSNQKKNPTPKQKLQGTPG